MDKQKIISILKIGLLGVAALIFIMMFLPGIVAKEPDGTILDSFSGAQIAFGYSESLGLGIMFKIKMNFLMFLAYFLPILAVIGLYVVQKFKPEFNTMFLGVLALAFVFTIIGTLTAIGVTKPVISGEIGTFDNGNFKLGVGSILAAILGFVGLGATASSFVLAKK